MSSPSPAWSLQPWHSWRAWSCSWWATTGSAGRCPRHGRRPCCSAWTCRAMPSLASRAGWELHRLPRCLPGSAREPARQMGSARAPGCFACMPTAEHVAAHQASQTSLTPMASTPVPPRPAGSLPAILGSLPALAVLQAGRNHLGGGLDAFAQASLAPNDCATVRALECMHVWAAVLLCSGLSLTPRV